MENPLLDSLNPQQRKAVLAKEGPVLIIAGAGSGKTRVLTSRIALLLQDGTAPEEILALTFTRKAAEEMRSRIRMMAGDGARQVVMGTFHSVFVRFLREYHAYVDFKENFTILDRDDAESCLKSCIAETLFGPDWNDEKVRKSLTDDQKKERARLLQRYKTREVASRISLLKNAYITPKDYAQTPLLHKTDLSHGRERLGDIYRLYLSRCHRDGAMDFDDILLYTYYLLDKYPDIARTLARRFRYILVDEYQDTNTIQYDIIRTMTLGHGNICAVGDDSQSIYAFRGAKIDNILNFRLDYPTYRSFKLETNYRSTPQIVEAANRLIENNTQRIPKCCNASRGGGQPIEIQYLRNDREEARFIASSIDYERRHDGRPLSDYAVLYRTNAQARALEEALIRQKIPYIIYSGLSFFERKEVKDVLSYMRLCVNPDDSEAFKRIANRPARGISENTLATLEAVAAKKEISIFTVAKELEDDPLGLKPAATRHVGEFIRLIETLSTEQRGLDALEAAKTILEKTGLYDYYSGEKDDDGRRRTANIEELLNGVRYYLEDQRSGDTDDLPDESLAAYLENVSLLSNADTASGGDDQDKDRVALMTSHCSKGLEFPTVFIAGCEEGLYPSVREPHIDAETEEERRLFYVSLTRAKDRLILTCCNERWSYGQRNECKPSRFLQELAED